MVRAAYHPLSPGSGVRVCLDSPEPELRTRKESSLSGQPERELPSSPWRELRAILGSDDWRVLAWLSGVIPRVALRLESENENETDVPSGPWLDRSSPSLELLRDNGNDATIRCSNAGGTGGRVPRAPVPPAPTSRIILRRRFCLRTMLSSTNRCFCSARSAAADASRASRCSLRARSFCRSISPTPPMASSTCRRFLSSVSAYANSSGGGEFVEVPSAPIVALIATSSVRCRT